MLLRWRFFIVDSDSDNDTGARYSLLDPPLHDQSDEMFAVGSPTTSHSSQEDTFMKFRSLDEAGEFNYQSQSYC